MPMWRYAMIATALLTGCVEDGDEAARVASPDHRVEAVVVEQGGGATTSYWYDVCVVAPGIECTSPNASVVLYGSTRNRDAYGVTLHWNDPSTLAVEYERAIRVTRKDPPVTPGSDVQIILKPGVTDPNAQPGAMHQR